MVKLRMNTADVAAEVRCLRRLIGMRCANVYDLTPKVSSKNLPLCFQLVFNRNRAWDVNGLQSGDQ